MDIRAVDLNLLKAFDALMSERAVTRAAGRIGLSQPAMSHALSRLRSLFADDLFVRTPAGMEPTAHAREIAPLISAAIEQIEAALNLGAGFDPARSAGIFSAGMAEYAEVALVGPLARAFAKEAPRATLRLLPLNGADAADQLERGMIDVAVAHLRTVPAAIETRPLLREPFVVVTRKGHPLAAAGARRHGGRDRPHPRRFWAAPPYLAIGRDLSGLARGARGRRSHRGGAVPHGAPDRRHGRDRDPAAADRSVDDRVDGLAPPRHQRTGAGLVPSASDGRGTGRGLTLDLERPLFGVGFARFISGLRRSKRSALPNRYSID